MSTHTSGIKNGHFIKFDTTKAQHQTYKHKDVRVLRESVAGMCNRLPEPFKTRLKQDLQLFALRVKEYCQCPETVYIEKEKAHACLFCGTRHKNLKVIENKNEGV